LNHGAAAAAAAGKEFSNGCVKMFRGIHGVCAFLLIKETGN
jgi:hypothetical protein